MDKTNKIKTIEWDKVSCCENCGNKEYYESSEMGISHRRFRLCTKCMNELLSSKKIANMCCDAMRKMGYVRTYGPQPITNAADTSLYRMVARFSRIVTSVGEIEKFETRGA